MRLICPNCGAQYEVPDGVIPQDGRDVQCSNCGDTWFQDHQNNVSDEDEETPRPDLVAPAEPEAESVSSPETDEPPVGGEPENAAENETVNETAPESRDPESRGIDPAVADILKQEAEHEAQIRAAEQSGGLEMQPDLGLQEAEDDASRRAREARERMARMRGETSDETEVADAMAATALGSRRDLLPNIEEINSTLRSTSDRQADGDLADGYLEPQQVHKKRGFRRGFILMLALAVILATIYIYAPKIAQSVPQADPALSGYVTMVDKGRAALNVQVKAVLEWLDVTASGGGQN